jgi:serine/threonine-protein kinase
MESGQTIAGKYRLNQLLGAGGMASVWSATNVFTERQVAVKFMLPAVARTEEAARRFLLEAKVSARIDHPNVIDVMDVGQTEDGMLFLVMELLTGVSLETALKRQQPPMMLHEFAFVMIEVARALAAAHKSGIIHRDLKPTNIFLHKAKGGEAIPKILDFGVSKFLDEENNHALTVAGTVLGSPLYMSPEQARGEADIDGRTDIFAFGGIMFEALCGARAYEGQNFNQLIVSIATKQPKNVDEHAPMMPAPLRAVARECLATDREKRVQSFELVAEHLLAALPGLEALPMRLPLPAGTSADPDATNALPVVRPSDRPPPMELADVSMGAQASWATPSGVTTRTVNTRRPPSTSTNVLLGGAGLGAIVLLGVIGLVVLVVTKRVHAVKPPAPPVVTIAPPETPAPPPSTIPTASAEPPVISVDSLPVVVKPGARANGRLSVAAAPGWCTLSIDGRSVGATPVASLDLTSGPHTLKCEAPSGKSKVATVVVSEGGTTRYKFSTDD